MNAVLQNKHAAIQELCQRYHVKRLELFGSGARDDFDPARSDFDFLVEFGDLKLGEHADAYFGLLEELQELLGRPVDLVMTRAVKNRYFLENIESTRRVLYAQ